MSGGAMDASKGRVPSHFGSADEYVSFMADPSRVLRIEWRRIRRLQSNGLMSHSVIEAHLQDGRRLRFEKLPDRGYVECDFPVGQGDIFGDIYRDCGADMHQLVRPLRARELRSVTAAVGGRPYSFCSGNCHHFCRDVWNAMVIEPLQCNTHPDRLKTDFLGGIPLPFGGVPKLGCIAVTQSPSDSDDDDCAGSQDKGERSLGPQDCKPDIFMWYEEAGRVSGRFMAKSHPAKGFDRRGRLQAFSRVLEAGALFMLELGSALLPVQHPSGSSVSRERLPYVWLTGVEPGIGMRIAERVAAADALELVTQLPSPADDFIDASSRGTGLVGSEISKGPAGSRRSVGVPSVELKGLVGDVSSVVLKTVSEVRLAVYAILKPTPQHGGSRSLRLLSGDFREAKEQFFAYTIKLLPQTHGVASAMELLHAESDALRAAVVTGEWGFVTLR